MQFRMFKPVAATIGLVFLSSMFACEKQHANGTVASPAKLKVATARVEEPSKSKDGGQKGQSQPVPSALNTATQELSDRQPVLPGPPVIAKLEWPGDAKVSPVELADKPNFDLPVTGDWNGVFYKYADFRAIQLHLEWEDRASGKLKGTAKLQKWVQKRREPSRFESQGSGTVVGTFDTATRELDITIGDFGLQNRGLDRTVYALKGVLAESPLEFAGDIFENRSNREPDRSKVKFSRPLGSGFVLAKQPGEKTPLIDRAAELNGLRARASAEKLANNGKLKDVPPEQLLTKIEQWIRRLESEYSKEELKGRKELYLRSINLFADEHFSKYFGVPFDQLPDVDSAILGKLIRRAARGREFGDQWRNKLNFYSGFERTFRMTGDYSRVDTISHLWPRRVIRRWKDQAYQSTVESPVYAQKFMDVERLRRSNLAWSKRLFPSEGNDQAYSALYQEIGPAVADGYIAKLVAASPSMETLNKLGRWRTDAPVKYSELPGTISHKHRVLIDKRSKFVLTELIQSHIDGLAALKDEAGSLEECCRLQREMLKHFSSHRFQSPVAEVFEYSKELRSALFERTWDTAKTKIAACTTLEEVAELRGEILPYPDGFKKVTFSIASETFDRKIAEINRPYFESLFSERELALMDKNNKIQIPATIAPPSDHEIRLAIVREIVEAVPHGRRTASNTLDFVFIAPMIVQKTQLQIRNVDQLSDPVEEAGEFRIKIQYTGRAKYKFLERDGFMTKLQNRLALLDSLSPTDPSVESFVLTSSGWRSPTMAQKLLKLRMLSVVSDMAMPREVHPYLQEFIDMKFPE